MCKTPAFATSGTPALPTPGGTGHDTPPEGGVGPLVPVQRSFDSSIEWGAPFLESLAPIGILPVSRHRVINDTSES